MRERPLAEVMHPLAAVWLQVGRLGKLRSRPLPPAVRRPVAAGRRAMWARTAPAAETPMAAMEARPPPAVLDPPSEI